MHLVTPCIGTVTRWVYAWLQPVLMFREPPVLASLDQGLKLYLPPVALPPSSPQWAGMWWWWLLLLLLTCGGPRNPSLCLFFLCSVICGDERERINHFPFCICIILSQLTFWGKVVTNVVLIDTQDVFSPSHLQCGVEHTTTTRVAPREPICFKKHQWIWT